MGINSIDQTLALWNGDADITECTFSLIVFCKRKPVSMPLSKSSCISQLLGDQQPSTSMCQVSRLKNVEQDPLYIDDGIWIFYNIRHTIYCQVSSSSNRLTETVLIRAAAVVRMQCDKLITCTDFQLPVMSCK